MVDDGFPIPDYDRDRMEPDPVPDPLVPPCPACRLPGRRSGGVLTCETQGCLVVVYMEGPRLPGAS